MLGHDNSIRLTIAANPNQNAGAITNPDGYSFFTRNVLPYLREPGATEDDVEALKIGNPRRYFSGDA